MIRSWSKQLLSYLISESNDTKCESNDCEAGPSKRPKKDDSSMNKSVNKDLILNSLQSIEKLASNSTKQEIEYPRMKDYLNTSLIYRGNASNNTFHLLVLVVLRI